nr:hypothetical protein Itr_chr08CG19770 [Ipomoea trifida]
MRWQDMECLNPYLFLDKKKKSRASCGFLRLSNSTMPSISEAFTPDTQASSGRSPRNFVIEGALMETVLKRKRSNFETASFLVGKNWEEEAVGLEGSSCATARAAAEVEGLQKKIENGNCDLGKNLMAAETEIQQSN